MTVDLSSYSVAAVKDEPDLIKFGYDFGLKALDGAEEVVTEDENGDLIIEGWAAVWDGVDRQGENFMPGAFQRGIKSFLEGSAALCFHHKSDKVLGKVLHLEEVEGKGLHMRARVDGAIKSHPELGAYYQQIKNGTLKGLSVGGFFKRKLTEAGQRISDMDFTEISVTGVPVHPAPSFAVVAGKALSIEMPTVPENVEETDEIREEDIFVISEAIAMLNATFDRINKRTADEKPASGPEITIGN